MRPRLGTTTAGLAVGITAAVVLACAAGAYFYSSHHFTSLVDNERSTALGEGELMRVAVEHQMVEHDRSLIGDLVHRLGSEPRVVNLLLLDRTGKVQYSSAPIGSTAEFQLSSPTCQACHRLPPDQRGSSRVLDTAGGTILRTVIPIRNREACHACHAAEQRINGVLIYDRDVGELRASMNRDLRWFVAGSGVLALALIAVIAVIVRVLILRRLQRFETTARQIAGGQLDRRVPAGGSDTISWLAREFNMMADSMTGLVGEVRHQRERLETVINSIDDGIVVLDARRQVVAANDAFLRRTGRTRELIVGCSCGEVGSGVCTVSDCPTLACLESGSRQVRICERRNTDGAVCWEEVHASPVRSHDGELLQVVEVWRDISERRAAEARLAESHRLASLGLLASGFSHELNTPLGTVLACVEGILRDTRGAADAVELSRVGEHATIAREQILRCRGITQHFLRMSRGQSSSPALVDLRAAIGAVARLIDPTARAHSVQVDADALPPDVHVRADEAELQHALMNLLLNAVQACRPGGHVRLSVSAADAIRIRITDDGCGIAPEHQQRIFEPFFGLRQGGTGLGLFLSLNFVRQWGGDIQVESVPGAGATFVIVIPAATRAVAYPSAS
jgi:PAS domain S-box-containing protein